MIMMPGCPCCGVSCIEDEQSSSESSGIFSIVYVPPGDQHCILIHFSDASAINVVVGIWDDADQAGTYEAIYSGNLYSSQTLCLQKPSGYNRLDIQITLLSFSSTWSYAISCDECDCGEFP